MAQSMSVNVRNFNSIKVRLKLQVLSTKKVQLIFQFHKGTIKTAQTSKTY